MFDIHGISATNELIPAQSATATVTGAAVDIKDYHGKAKVILLSSAGDDADATLNVKLQDSVDGSTGWADISGATFTEVTDAADSTETIGLAVDGVKQYIRAVGTFAGATPVFAFGVVLVGAKTPVVSS